MQVTAILVIDEYDGFREAMEFCLPRFGHTARGAGSVEAGVAALNEGGVELVLLDAGRVRACGVMACARVRAAAGKCMPIVLMSTFGDREFERQARAAGASEVMSKPFRWEELLVTIARLRRWATEGTGKPASGR